MFCLHIATGSNHRLNEEVESHLIHFQNSRQYKERGETKLLVKDLCSMAHLSLSFKPSQISNRQRVDNRANKRNKIELESSQEWPRNQETVELLVPFVK